MLITLREGQLRKLNLRRKLRCVCTIDLFTVKKSTQAIRCSIDHVTIFTHGQMTVSVNNSPILALRACEFEYIILALVLLYYTI
ncbi:hypothetical protein C0J52_14758 [Blattella germanica]|nr:hypothetical protein C0J52_14758 [Blattella germanica]